MCVFVEMPADPPKKPLQVIKKNCRFSRRLTREVSIASSMKDNNNYHGGVSVSVPFRWESEPGTPKVRSRENPLPPLTPPPSYFYSNPSPKTPIRSSSKNSKSHILDTIFPKRATKKTTKSSHLPSSPTFFYSSSSSGSSSGSSSPRPVSSFSVPSSPARPLEFRRRYRDVSRPRLSFDSRAVVDRDGGEISSFCSGRGGTNPRFRGCYASMIKVLLH